MIAAFHLFASRHVTCVEVTRNSDVGLADFELVGGALRIHVTQLLISVVAHYALDALSFLLFGVFVINVSLGITIRLAV